MFATAQVEELNTVFAAVGATLVVARSDAGLKPPRQESEALTG